jgi:hypothetical protein
MQSLALPMVCLPANTYSVFSFWAFPCAHVPKDTDAALAAIKPAAIRADMRFLADDLLQGSRRPSGSQEISSECHFRALPGTKTLREPDLNWTLVRCKLGRAEPIIDRRASRFVSYRVVHDCSPEPRRHFDRPNRRRDIEVLTTTPRSWNHA